MEQLFIGIIFILAFGLIVNRIRKLFTRDCGECSGGCSCCQSPMPQPREIKLDTNVKE